MKKNFDISVIEDYNKYCQVRDKLNSDMVFDILTKKESKQIDMVRELLGDSSEVLDDFMKSHKKFDLKKFISYLNKVIKECVKGQFKAILTEILQDKKIKDILRDRVLKSLDLKEVD